MDDDKKIKIMFDVTGLFDQYAGRGIGRYIRDMLFRLVRIIIEEGEWEIHMVGFNDLDQNLIEIGFSKFSVEQYSDHIFFHSLGEPTNSSWRNIFRWKDFDSVIYEIEPDIYFAPHFERGLPTTKILNHQFVPKHTVVVVHDVIPLVNSSFSRKNWFFNKLKGLFYRFMWSGVENANLVITSSNFSKKDLIHYGHVPESIIRTIYLGINEGFYREKVMELDESDRKEVLKRFGVEDKSYFFYDSGLESNKGIDKLLNALEELYKRNKVELPDYFVLTGGDFYQGVGEEVKARTDLGRYYLKQIRKKGLVSKLVTTSKINEEELHILLVNAHAYVYFSEYEGFGFGPVQAMAAEVPSIVNNASCLPEITDGGSLLVDTSDVGSVTSKLEQIVTDDQLRSELIKKGKSVAKKYNWTDTATKTLDELKSLV